MHQKTKHDFQITNLSKLPVFTFLFEASKSELYSLQRMQTKKIYYTHSMLYYWWFYS